MNLPSSKMKYGYCGMTADFLHIGHIRFLIQCRRSCDYLIVGVMTDSCVEKYKGRRPIMPYQDRADLVLSLRAVSQVMEQKEYDFPDDVMRWKKSLGNSLIIFDSDDHSRKGADVIIPYSQGISSTLFKRIINEDSNTSQLKI